MGKEALAEPVRSSESLFLSPLVPSEGLAKRAWGSVPPRGCGPCGEEYPLHPPQPRGYSCLGVIPTPHALLSPPSLGLSVPGSPPGLGDDGVCSRVIALCAPPGTACTLQ